MTCPRGDLFGGCQFDLYVTHLTQETNTLWTQAPRGLFRDQTAAAGLANPRWRGTGFGTVLGDFDHDGSLDIAVANGGVRLSNRHPPEGAHTFWGRYYERNQLFANDGKGKFRDISEGDPFYAEPALSRGL